MGCTDRPSDPLFADGRWWDSHGAYFAHVFGAVHEGRNCDCRPITLPPRETPVANRSQGQ